MGDAPDFGRPAQHMKAVESGASRDLVFGFGRNWSRFLREIDEGRIREAESSLVQLGLSNLEGNTFLDVGCGSGLFSLAARRLGAKVHGFDVDPASVAAARALKATCVGEDADWVVEEGSILDASYVRSLGTFDYVYAWGVLHHTGDMWLAVDNILQVVAPDGLLCLALYNDQGGSSRRWLYVKRLYNRFRFLRPLLLVFSFIKLQWRGWLLGLWRRRSFSPARSYPGDNRGMSLWRDTVDWVGGYPFEVSTPDEVIDRLHRSGFQLVKLKTRQGTGNNEFVFKKLT